ncbi:hypothetical protein CO724_17310 [Ectopseudomonas mendocina]|nr:hypothetical protein CO724_17310 [Pseudomonas mendocina]
MHAVRVSLARLRLWLPGAGDQILGHLMPARAGVVDQDASDDEYSAAGAEFVGTIGLASHGLPPWMM